MKDVSPTSVTCERYMVCCLCCYATSDSPVSYLWTKNGQDPINDDIKVMNNNSIFITPRSAQDYGVYMCNASNSFGSTSYEITLIEDRKSLTKATTMEDDSECILFVCLFVHLLVCISIPLNKYLGYLGHWLLVHGECNREDRRKTQAGDERDQRRGGVWERKGEHVTSTFSLPYPARHQSAFSTVQTDREPRTDYMIASG